MSSLSSDVLVSSVVVVGGAVVGVEVVVGAGVVVGVLDVEEVVVEVVDEVTAVELVVEEVVESLASVPDGSSPQPAARVRTSVAARAAASGRALKSRRSSLPGAGRSAGSR